MANNWCCSCLAKNLGNQFNLDSALTSSDWGVLSKAIGWGDLYYNLMLANKMVAYYSKQTQGSAFKSRGLSLNLPTSSQFTKFDSDLK